MKYRPDKISGAENPVALLRGGAWIEMIWLLVNTYKAIVALLRGGAWIEISKN